MYAKFDSIQNYYDCDGYLEGHGAIAIFILREFILRKEKKRERHSGVSRPIRRTRREYRDLFSSSREYFGPLRIRVDSDIVIERFEGGQQRGARHQPGVRQVQDTRVHVEITRRTNTISYYSVSVVLATLRELRLRGCKYLYRRSVRKF